MNPVRVLVVDDSALMRKLIPQILQTTVRSRWWAPRSTVRRPQKNQDLTPGVTSTGDAGMGGIDMLKSCAATACPSLW
jgi:chemotaxis response regulator CheB